MLIRSQNRPVIVPREPLLDDTLSWAAKGLLAFICANLPDNGEFNESDFPAELIKELEVAGYIVR